MWTSTISRRRNPATRIAGDKWSTVDEARIASRTTVKPEPQFHSQLLECPIELERFKMAKSILGERCEPVRDNPFDRKPVVPLLNLLGNRVLLAANPCTVLFSIIQR